MEYNELVKALRCDGNNIGQDSGGCTNKKCRYRDPDSACNIVSICEDAATAITDLLARAEKAERESDEAREVICTRCSVLPCRGNECYWYRGQKEE